MSTWKSCPYCAAQLPEEASFCPHCARSLNARRTLGPPRRLSGRALRCVLALLAALALSLTVWLAVRPKVYDNHTAEVIYTDADGSYQLLLNYWGDRFQPMTEYTEEVEEGSESNKPSRLFVNHVDTGVNAKEAFLRKLDSVTVEFLQGDGGPSPWKCTAPEAMSFAPEAALVSILTYTDLSGSMELRWTIHMKNGDTILLYQRFELGVVPTRHYYPEDVPMGTTQELQALVDEINETVNPGIIVYLHLPAVTYEGSLAVESRATNLIGSEGADGSRTTFTGTLQATASKGYICQFSNLDFAGSGEGVGVSASARINFSGCRFSGWRTGLLSYGDSWVNFKNCTFEDNSIGFHFNSTSENSNDHLYSENLFQRNGTALLLENVPGSQALYFSGTRFSHNGTDIDNLCRHELDISQAIFE